jgi:hypothetical protein
MKHKVIPGNQKPEQHTWKLYKTTKIAILGTTHILGESSDVKVQNILSGKYHYIVTKTVTAGWLEHYIT